MSYILNALRKSERERQAMQPDTVTSRIAVQQTLERPSPVKIIVVLVLLNLAILAYFLGIAPQLPEGKQPPEAHIETPAPSIANTKPQPAADSPPKPAKMPPAPRIEQARNLAPAPEKPVTNPKPAAEPLQRLKPADAPPQPVKPLPTINAKPALTTSPAAELKQHSSLVPPPFAEPGEPAAKKPESVASARPRDEVPALQDMPPELRQSLPALPINVLSYSSTPAERFVMIDMVKYVPGQTIKNQLELKEIVEDGIIVRYEGHVFKIKR